MVRLNKFFIEGTIKYVLGLGVTTTIGYGTLFYSFTIMSQEFEKEFYWSKTFIFGIFSLGIFLGGLLAPKIGKLLDNHGARAIMSVGSILCALGLFLVSNVQTQWHYIISIVFLEVVSTLVLYEAAFVAFSQLAGNKARLPITQITLIAGFASTIFWPLISFLLSFLSWREVYLILASFHLFIALPIHFFILKKDAIIKTDIKFSNSFDDSLELEGKLRKKSLILVGIVFSLIAIPITVMQTHFLRLMNGFGIEMTSAIALGALIGPSQVGSRIIEITISKKITPLTSGIFSTSIMSLGILTLYFSGYDILLATFFVILYGAGQGLTDIIRGSIPLYLFGKDNLGKTIGGINLYRNIIVSLVPFGFAFLMETFGVRSSTLFLVFVTTFAMILLIILNKKVLKEVK